MVAAGYRVCYTTAADLVAAMRAAFLEGTWTQKLRSDTAPSLLVIDELGYLPMDRRGAHALFQEDDTVAAAILDRLLGNAVVINIRGERYRMRTHRAPTAACSKRPAKG